MNVYIQEILQWVIDVENGFVNNLYLMIFTLENIFDCIYTSDHSKYLDYKYSLITISRIGASGRYYYIII